MGQTIFSFLSRHTNAFQTGCVQIKTPVMTRRQLTPDVDYQINSCKLKRNVLVPGGLVNLPNNQSGGQSAAKGIHGIIKILQSQGGVS